MTENEIMEKDEIYSRALRAGRRTYFFDVRPTKAGDYYLTITESKKFGTEDGGGEYKKHKIYLYKEDFEGFISLLDDATSFIVNEKGEEVISERHVRDYKRPFEESFAENEAQQQPDGYLEQTDCPNQEKEDIESVSSSRFTHIEFDDI